MISSSTPSSAAPPGMRLVSYNIHKGIGGRDRRYRLERIIEVLDEHQPDLICLQEVTQGVRRLGYHDQPQLLADRFRATPLYQRNVELRSGGYGNLVLCRWPLEVTHQISLRLSGRKPRGAQLAVIRTPAGPLHLVHFHLGLAEHERHWQIDRLLEHPAFQQGAGLPTLLVGDFNDWRNTLARGALAQHGLVQATAPPARFRSFPAWLPLGSLDKAFHRGSLVIDAARIGRSPLARSASDHLPLVIDFHLASNGAGTATVSEAHLDSAAG